MVAIRIPDELKTLKPPYNSFELTYFSADFVETPENYLVITEQLPNCLKAAQIIVQYPFIYENLPDILRNNEFLIDPLTPVVRVIKTFDDFSIGAVENCLKSDKIFGEIRDSNVEAVSVAMLRRMALGRAYKAFVWIDHTLSMAKDEALEEHYLKLAKDLWKEIPGEDDFYIFDQFLFSLSNIRVKKRIPLLEMMIADEYSDRMIPDRYLKTINMRDKLIEKRRVALLYV